MSNLEHIFESAIVAMEKGHTQGEWNLQMWDSNCAGHAVSIDLAYRGKSSVVTAKAKLDDGREIWVNDIWELARYVYPWLKNPDNSKEEKE